MATHSLKSVYIAQLQTMVSADRQSLELTKQMREHAVDEDLRKGLENGTCGIEEGLEKVLAVLDTHDADTEGPVCNAMAGMVADTRTRVFESDFEDDAARDSAIIAQYMQLTYYGLAGYKTLTEYANTLGLAQDGEKLQTCYENAQDGQSDMHELLSGTAVREAA